MEKYFTIKENDGKIKTFFKFFGSVLLIPLSLYVMFILIERLRVNTDTLNVLFVISHFLLIILLISTLIKNVLVIKRRTNTSDGF